MTHPIDPPSRRDFFKTLGAAALPLLASASACDRDLDAPRQARFRARPGGSKTKQTSVEVGRALLEQVLISDRQRCSLPGKFAGLASVGQQVRITHPERGPAVYTVDELRRDDNPDYVRMNLSARLRLGVTEGFDAVLSNRITADLSDAEAEARSEFVERLVDGGGDGLVVLAPHGGAIEARTDDQAERLTAALGGASSWICKGWREGGGAFDRWHIRSTDLDPRSFAGLGKIAGRGFAYAVAFHGMTSADGVLIGGGGPLWLKQQVAAAIRGVIGKGTEVGIATTADLYDGDRSDNLVNWITAGGVGGVQVEQSRAVRDHHWRAIADAIAGVYAGLL